MRTPESLPERARKGAQLAAARLKEHGCSLILRPGIHQKYAIIDDRIVWYGGINLLSFGASKESLMRLVSGSIARELMKTEALNENQRTEKATKRHGESRTCRPAMQAL